MRLEFLVVLLSACASPARPSIASTPIDFGAAFCGDSLPPKTLTVANEGGSDFTFTAVLHGGASLYDVSPISETVQPGHAGLLTITPHIPIPLTSLDEDLGDTLEITTDVKGDTVHTVALTQSARYAQLTFEAVNGKPPYFLPALSFPDTAVGASATQQFQIYNSGNADAQIGVDVLPLESEFSLDFGGVTETVPAGGALTGTVTFAPTSSGDKSATVAFGMFGPNCTADSPANLSLTGTSP